MGTYTHDQQKIFGISSFYDLCKSMFKLGQVKMARLINVSIAITMLLIFIPALEEWVWSPFWTLILLVGVITLDFISAVASNWGKEKFKTEKAAKVPIVIFCYILLLAILNSLGKVMESFEMDHIFNPIAFDYLAKSVYFLCFSINFLSALKHMSNLGLLPKQVSNYIAKFIDIQKNKMETAVVGEINNTPGEAPSKSEEI